jgi:hypothetical protein
VLKSSRAISRVGVELKTNVSEISAVSIDVIALEDFSTCILLASFNQILLLILVVPAVVDHSPCACIVQPTAGGSSRFLGSETTFSAAVKLSHKL